PPNLIQKEWGGAQPALEAASETLGRTHVVNNLHLVFSVVSLAKKAFLGRGCISIMDNVSFVKRKDPISCFKH
ncbi:MAG TPA: hypothetical protein VHD63_05770, partial [Ktedonobacteraceae bacterium]|nr:hypothetical protein [Ktedonobacteraceae bacterium]